MNINKLIIYISIIASLIIIGLPTLNKVMDKSDEKKEMVTEKYIIESAQKCFYEEKCLNSTISLKELYEKGYIKEKQVNPITKEYYDENSYVTLKKKDSSFHLA